MIDYFVSFYIIKTVKRAVMAKDYASVGEGIMKTTWKTVGRHG